MATIMTAAPRTSLHQRRRPRAGSLSEGSGAGGARRNAGGRIIVSKALHVDSDSTSSSSSSSVEARKNALLQLCLEQRRGGEGEYTTPSWVCFIAETLLYRVMKTPGHRGRRVCI
jgi:hypothetical protein